MKQEQKNARWTTFPLHAMRRFYIPPQNLACCGNCKNRQSMDMGDKHEEWCRYDGMNYQSNALCKKWAFDLLKENDRLVDRPE